MGTPNARQVFINLQFVFRACKNAPGERVLRRLRLLTPEPSAPRSPAIPTKMRPPIIRSTIIATLIFSCCIASAQQAVELKQLELAASQGNADAQLSLGFAYAEGTGVPKDTARAIEWYQKAIKWYQKNAVQGNTKAQYNLGFMYAGGMGVSQDVVQAYAWFKIAALNGDPKGSEAQGNLEASLTIEEKAKAQKIFAELLLACVHNANKSH